MLAEGERLGHYRILHELGKGGMGHVYLAMHEDLDAKVALKELILPADAAEAHIDRFRFEGRILHKLRHPRLPLVYDFFKENEKYYIAMEFVEGHSLSQLVRDEGAPDPHTLQLWALQLVDVLDYLHTHDPPIIFRDLKPSNIMVTAQRDLKLIDFGIAKLFDQVGGDGQTSTAIRGAGTPGFAPPEQYGVGTDERSDIYALGATLYSIAACQVPPPSVSLAAGAMTLTPLDVPRPDIPAGLCKAIHHMMGLRREDRPQTMGQVRAELTAALPPSEGLLDEDSTHPLPQYKRPAPATPAPPPAPAPVASPPAGTPHKSALPLVVGALGGLALVGVLAHSFFASPAPPPAATATQTVEVVVTASPATVAVQTTAPPTHAPTKAPTHRNPKPHHAKPPVIAAVPTPAPAQTVIMMPANPVTLPAPPQQVPIAVQPPPAAAADPYDDYQRRAATVLNDLKTACSAVPDTGKGPGLDVFAENATAGITHLNDLLQETKVHPQSLTDLQNAARALSNLKTAWDAQARMASQMGGPRLPPPPGGPGGSGGGGFPLPPPPGQGDGQGDGQGNPPPDPGQIDKFAGQIKDALGEATRALNDAATHLQQHN